MSVRSTHGSEPTLPSPLTYFPPRFLEASLNVLILYSIVKSKLYRRPEVWPVSNNAFFCKSSLLCTSGDGWKGVLPNFGTQCTDASSWLISKQHHIYNSRMPLTGNWKKNNLRFKGYLVLPWVHLGKLFTLQSHLNRSVLSWTALMWQSLIFSALAGFSPGNTYPMMALSGFLSLIYPECSLRLQHFRWLNIHVE